MKGKESNDSNRSNIESSSDRRANTNSSYTNTYET